MKKLIILGQKGEGRQIFAVKRETQEIYESTEAEAVDALGAYLTAGKSYLVRGRLPFQCGADGGAKFGFSADADLKYIRIAIHDAVAGDTPVDAYSTTGEAVGDPLQAGEHTLEISGYILNAHGGDFLLMAAQNSSNALALSLRVGGYLEFIELD